MTECHSVHRVHFEFSLCECHTVHAVHLVFSLCKRHTVHTVQTETEKSPEKAYAGKLPKKFQIYVCVKTAGILTSGNICTVLHQFRMYTRQFTAHQRRMPDRLTTVQLPTGRQRATHWTSGTLRVLVDNIQSGTTRANRGPPEAHRGQMSRGTKDTGHRRGVVHSSRWEEMKPKH